MEHKNIGKIHGIDYHTYIQSEAWQMKCQMVAKLANYTCQRCHKVVLKGFHVHHLTYKRFGNEALSDLMFLCEDCHNKVHEEKRNAKLKRQEEIKHAQTLTVKKEQDKRGKFVVGNVRVNRGVCPSCGCKRVDIYTKKGKHYAYCKECGEMTKRLNVKDKNKLGIINVNENKKMSSKNIHKNKRPKVIKQPNKTLIFERETMSGIVCSHCGCKEFNIYKLSTNVGVYCSACGKYIKFLNAKEREKLGV